jgi:uncharacterized protein (TIGR04255 family)
LTSRIREVYAKAPIVEAVLDIRVRLRATPDLQTLSGISDPAYPDNFRQPFQLQVRIQGGVAPDQPSIEPSIEQLSRPLGAMHRSSDEKQVFQARIDGFTFNRLAPYENWGSFAREARRLWGVYRDAVQVERIESLALTYLNQIGLPLGASFEEYFRTYIEVAPELPQTLTNYSLSFQVDLPGGHGVLSITQGYGPPRREGFVNNLLNIQALKIIGEDVNPSEQELWQMFERLRDAKSDAFEACITDRVREMIR